MKRREKYSYVRENMRREMMAALILCGLQSYCDSHIVVFTRFSVR